MKQYIEQTLLRQDITQKELENFLEEAKQNEFFGVCINPSNVKFAKEYLKGTSIKIITVVGFPLGASTSKTKAFEACDAIENGADEIDMVINLTNLKSKQYTEAKEDIETVVKACKNTPVKVIIETDLLTEEEIKIASQICIKAGAKFVKTSTGFVKDGVGAKEKDVELMYETVKNYNLQVKASGGIKTYEDAQKLIKKGASRLGTSSGIKILKEAQE